MLLELPIESKITPFPSFASASWFQPPSANLVNVVPSNPVGTVPAGVFVANKYSEFVSIYFLQYDGEPAENVASFAFERF